MTWHSSVGLKCIEGDAEESLSKQYLKAAKYDSKQCDLILSGSAFRTQIIKRAFWYNGEILEAGTPRNDVFFKKKIQQTYRKNVLAFYHLQENDTVILYAPTFRNNDSLDYYRVNWDKVIENAKRSFSSDVHVLVKLHPNVIKNGLDTSSLTAFNNTHDATLYPDMQELLCASDVLITDYSSSMFDFPLTGKPVILYATDYYNYDRNLYFQFKCMPFAFLESEDKLVDFFNNFDKDEYRKKVDKFMADKIGSFESGNGCYSVIQWMNMHKNQL